MNTTMKSWLAPFMAIWSAEFDHENFEQVLGLLSPKDNDDPTSLLNKIMLEVGFPKKDVEGHNYGIEDVRKASAQSVMGRLLVHLDSEATDGKAQKKADQLARRAMTCLQTNIMPEWLPEAIADVVDKHIPGAEAMDSFRKIWAFHIVMQSLNRFATQFMDHELSDGDSIRIGGKHIKGLKGLADFLTQMGEGKGKHGDIDDLLGSILRKGEDDTDDPDDDSN